MAFIGTLETIVAIEFSVSGFKHSIKKWLDTQHHFHLNRLFTLPDYSIRIYGIAFALNTDKNIGLYRLIEP